jgi:hypothetical protein
MQISMQPGFYEMVPVKITFFNKYSVIPIFKVSL